MSNETSQSDAVRRVGAHAAKEEVAKLEHPAVRGCYSSHHSRLSSSAGMARRYRNLAKGHLHILREHASVMSHSASGKRFARYERTAVPARLS